MSVDDRWSVTLYDEEGWIPVNENNAYSFNDVTVRKISGGSTAIHFEGDPKEPNLLPLEPGCNYVARLYR